MIFKLFMILWIPLLFGDSRVITLERFPNLGMFASLNQVLGQLYLLESGRIKESSIYVNFKDFGVYYDPSIGENWWTYYFEQIGENSSLNDQSLCFEDYTQAWNVRANLSRNQAASIVRKYIRIKPHILEKVATFIDHFFSDQFIIGVHYRGTDKKSEAPYVEYEKMFQAIDDNTPKNRPYRIFIATDELDFLEEAQKRYPNTVITTPSFRSSKGGVAVHHFHKHNYLIGEEALIDSLLLSKSDLLIRTSSNLSLWSTYFNPNLRTILLNKRYRPTCEPE